MQLYRDELLFVLMLTVFVVGCFFIHPTYLHHIFLLYCLVWAVLWFSTKKNRLLRGVLCFLCLLFWIILDAITFLPPDYNSKENIEKRRAGRESTLILKPGSIILP